MQKQTITKPTVILMYGYPGSGKSYFGRQFAEETSTAYICADQLRHEFFDEPTYSKDETEVVDHLTLYMLGTYLKSGLSVVYDCDNDRLPSRKLVYSVAKSNKAQPIVVWIQIDIESCFSRVVNRDLRKIDDKYAEKLDRTSFESKISKMQNVISSEDYIVLSGKHAYSTQKRALLKKLFENGLLDNDFALSNLAKPELVNLVPNPNPGRVDTNRRNINIY
ncbi:MAG TPA: AAA family ATPase [Candidatus Saccharimonadia bacterium]|nr:AAA family ATPase [Candidatus Saccharimonadia bacterium]